jgi:hypothetical protein
MIRKWQYPPQLAYNAEWDRYVLRLPYGPEYDVDASYEMVIENHGDEANYRFIMHMDGEHYECITRADYNERLQSIQDHEGPEVRDLWHQYQDYFHVVPESHGVFTLQAWWETLMKLNLFQVPPTWRHWEYRPMSAEGKAKLEEARERYFLDTADGTEGE